EPPAVADTLSETLGANAAPADAGDVAAFARAHRPELTSERGRLGRAHTEQSAIAAERLPRVDGIGDWGLSGIHWNDAFPTREYGATVTLPLVDGLRRESRIAEQAAVGRESEVRLRDLEDQVAAELAAARLDLASGDEQLRV